MTQLFILYRAYHALELLHRVGGRENTECARCAQSPGSFFHLFWRCPKLFQYWKEVLDLLNSVYDTTLIPDPNLCLLGFINFNGLDGDQTVVIMRSLFIAPKLIASCWVSPNPSTFGHCICEMDKYVIFKKHTYAQRNTSQRFEKIWRKWLDAPRPNFNLNL